MTDYTSAIDSYLNDEIAVLKKLDLVALNNALDAIQRAWKREATIYTFGNGGSAATASHMANDFNKGISEHVEKKFKMLCLCDNTATIMAIANDISYDDVFSFQLEGILKPTDLVIALSGSGNSTNVIKAVEYAKSIGTEVVGLSGYDGGRLKSLADYPMHVDIQDMQIVEDIHMVFDHMMMRVLRTYLQQ